MKLIAFMSGVVNKRLREHSKITQTGYANGYVAVPPEHPYYGKDYDDVPVEIHGGLTFGRKYEAGCQTEGDWEMEFIEGNHIPEGWWVFGFDTCHFNDSLATWPRERCVEETLSLKTQLEELANSNNE